MNYFGMLGFSLVFAGGSLFFGLIAYKLHMWWQNRSTRQSLKAIRQLEDEHYAGLRESLLSHIDELLKEVDR